MDEFINVVNHNSQIFHSIHLLGRSSEPQTSTDIELTTTSAPSVTDKNQNKYVLYSQNNIHNDETITNNDDIQSCETAKNKL